MTVKLPVRLHIGDVRDKIAEIPDGSVDLVCTSPPFLALRKYGDNPDEMGSEGTPADFLDALLELTQEFRRVLAPHGSIAIELGDTYSGSGDPGWDRTINPAHRSEGRMRGGNGDGRSRDTSRGWPLSKSLVLAPGLYAASLAYGRNLLRQPPSAREMLAISQEFVDRQPDASALTLHEHLMQWYSAIELGPAGEFDPWRVRNIITWCRPNPPVGALGDKVRPATSYITIACPSAKRWFDLDAVRGDVSEWTRRYGDSYPISEQHKDAVGKRGSATSAYLDGKGVAQQGAPPLDWWDDALNPDDPTDHLTIVMPTQPYPGAHYATWPAKLAQRLIEMMCPLRVCTTCGKPSERIVEATEEYAAAIGDMMTACKAETSGSNASNPEKLNRGAAGIKAGVRSVPYGKATLGWSDCGHNTWRPGHTLDPFAGSGTTLAVAQGLGRDATGIELYPANAHLIAERVGMFLEVVDGDDGSVPAATPTHNQTGAPRFRVGYKHGNPAATGDKKDYGA